MRLLENAAGSDAADHAGQLERRGGNGALSGGYGNHFAGVPLAMKSPLDPFLRRHEAGLFGGKIDAGLVADAEFAGVIRKPVDSQAHADVVEKDVAGLQNGVVQTEDAVRLRTGLGVVHPAMILAAEERAVAGAKGGETFLGDMVLEHGRGGDDFENGAGSELRLNGAVQQRMQRIVVESLPFIRRNSDGEIVGIRRGAADHGEHFAGARIESNHGAGALAERLFGDLLQVVVDGELNLFAGNGFLLSETAEIFDLLANAVDDDAAHAVGAGEDVVVLALETGFSGEISGAEAAIAGFDLLLADFADVPAGVRHEAAGKITAALDHEHFEQRNIRAVRFDERDVRVGGFRLDDDGLKLRKIFGVFELILEVADRNAQAIRNGGKIFVDQSGIVAEKKDAERRIVVDENAAIAIEHAAAWSDDGDGTNAIALGHLPVLIGVNDLEFPEAEQQQPDHAHDDVGSDGQSGLWQTIVVAKPVRHENPARENLFLLRSSNGRRCHQGESSPVPREAGTCSRHEKICSVGFEMSVENFFRKKNSKNFLRDPESLPDYCCNK